MVDYHYNNNIKAIIFGVRKTGPWLEADDEFSRLDTVPACNGQLGRHRD